jgi:hypothetical protein
MALPIFTRQKLLGAALILTLVAVIWVHGQTQDESAGEVVMSVKTRSIQKHLAQNDTRLALGKLYRADDNVTTKMKDVFQPTSWYIPPRPVPAPPPPPPMAPALPFQYIGKLMEGGVLTVFVTKQGQNYAIKSGDTLDDIYHVDSIESQRVIFTYLPLNIQQSLATGNLI